jgi:hypothetical protein
MLELARNMLAAGELFEVVSTIGKDAFCPLAEGTLIVGCEVSA